MSERVLNTSMITPLKISRNSQWSIYLLKVNNKNTRTRCEICSTLTIKTPKRRDWRRSSVFIVNFEHTFTPCFSASIVGWPSFRKNFFTFNEILNFMTFAVVEFLLEELKNILDLAQYNFLHLLTIIFPHHIETRQLICRFLYDWEHWSLMG